SFTFCTKNNQKFLGMNERCFTVYQAIHNQSIHSQLKKDLIENQWKLHENRFRKKAAMGMNQGSECSSSSGNGVILFQENLASFSRSSHLIFSFHPHQPCVALVYFSSQSTYFFFFESQSEKRKTNIMRRRKKNSLELYKIKGP
ncbi:uncharacterized protein VP01_7617g1, partial [Puccinia sorghi]